MAYSPRILVVALLLALACAQSPSSTTSPSSTSTPSSTPSPTPSSSGASSTASASVTPFPMLPSASASLSVGASPSATGTPMLPVFSAAPSVDPANRDAYRTVVYKYVVAGARPSEVLTPAVLTPTINAMAAALGVPTANIVVSAYQDRSAAAARLLRMLQAGSGSTGTVLEFTVRTTPQTASAPMVLGTVTTLAPAIVASITSVTTNALAASTGRSTATFAAAFDYASVAVAPAPITTSAPASAASITGGQIAGAVIGAIVGVVILAGIVYAAFVLNAPAPQQAPTTIRIVTAPEDSEQASAARPAAVVVAGQSVAGYQNNNFGRPDFAPTGTGASAAV